jgi:ribosomal-protein-serine acetyltransferase
MFCLPVDEEIKLGLLEEAQADTLFALVEVNRAHLRRWLPWLDSNTAPEHSRQFIKSSREQFARNEGFTAGIFYQERLVGMFGSHKVDWTNRAVEFGYWLGAPYEGRGIVTRASRAGLDYFFGEMQLNRVQLRCAVGNERSCAIPKRLGFSHEGVMRQAEWLYDHYLDHHLFSLLADEWLRQK